MSAMPESVTATRALATIDHTDVELVIELLRAVTATHPELDGITGLSPAEIQLIRDTRHNDAARQLANKQIRVRFREEAQPIMPAAPQADPATATRRAQADA